MSAVRDPGGRRGGDHDQRARPGLVTEWARQRPGAALWLAVFLYAGLVAIVVQTVVMPRWAPAWHAGHGLLQGVDAVTYHDLAEQRAHAIRADGWAVWRLRPRGHVPAGIASAVYAATVAEPWTLIPLNAALHAAAALTLFRILRLFAPVGIALAGVVPLALFPSALTWYAQIGKDGLSVLGALLVALGWARIARAASDPGAGLGRGLPVMVAGAAVAWLGRPYAPDLLLGVGIVLALLLTGVALGHLARRTWAARTAGRALVRTGAAMLMIWALAALPGTQRLVDVLVPIEGHGWTRSAWLPVAVDRRLEKLARARFGYLLSYPRAGSVVDPGVVLRSAGEVIAYLPRALHVALFAPFPSDWLAPAATTGGSAMRRVVGGEMLVLYLALAVLPWALWRWRERLELHVLLVYGLATTLIYALAIPNVGALYRFRYPFAILLIGLAVATLGRGERARAAAPTPAPVIDEGAVRSTPGST